MRRDIVIVLNINRITRVSRHATRQLSFSRETFTRAPGLNDDAQSER